MGFQRRAQHQPTIHAKGMYTSLPTYVTMMNKNLVLMIGVSSLSTVSAPAYIQHVESKFFDILKWSDVFYHMSTTCTVMPRNSVLCEKIEDILFF